MKGGGAMHWFSFFLLYSFLGYLLERSFAKVTGSPRQVRKCFLLLPLCPVYGAAMVVFLSSTDVFALSLPHLIFRGALFCTVVEYLFHLWYDLIFRVRFWDYGERFGNLGGRISLPFSLLWGILSALAARVIHPLLAPIAAAAPPLLLWLLLLLLTADAVLTAALLLRYHDTELLTLRAVVRHLEEE